MKVAVRHLKSSNDECDALALEGPTLRLGEPACHGEERARGCPVQIHPLIDFGAWDDKEMSSGNGIDRHERGAELVLVDERPRDLSGHDLREDRRHKPTLGQFATVFVVRHRIATLPNMVTLVRLLCLPVVPWLLLLEERRTAAAVVLGALGSTDWVDGWLARRLGQVSEFGTVFDPIVDRLLFVVGAGAVLVDGSVPAWFVLAVVARELLVGGMMTVGTVLGMPRFPVSPWGKRYTFLLMIAIPLLLLASDGGQWAWVASLTGWMLGLVGLVMGWVVGFQYAPKVRAEVGKVRTSRTVR